MSIEARVAGGSPPAPYEAVRGAPALRDMLSVAFMRPSGVNVVLRHSRTPMALEVTSAWAFAEQFAEQTGSYLVQKAFGGG